MEIIKVCVSPEEKELLTKIAKDKHISVSQLIKDQCECYLHPTAKYTNTSLDIHMLNNNRSHKLVVLVSDDEYEQLKKFADNKGWTISRYIREKLYEKTISIDINYDSYDIYELVAIISDTYRHLIGTAEGLMHRNIIYEHDKERLLTLGYEIRDTLKEYVKQIYRNRNSVRRTAIRHLDKKIENAINELYQNKNN